MKYFIILLLAFSCIFSYAEKKPQNFVEKLLRDNFKTNPYMAWVKVIKVEEKGRLMLYPTYLLKCEVRETFKGKVLKKIAFFCAVEEGYKKLPIGKEYIVSLFYEKKKKVYYLGDNGYDLPVTKKLLKVARELKEKWAKKRKNKESFPAI